MSSSASAKGSKDFRSVVRKRQWGLRRGAQVGLSGVRVLSIEADIKLADVCRVTLGGD